MALTRSEFKYILPCKMRAELREPLGLLVEDGSFDISSVHGGIITVGDIITMRFIKESRLPWISVIDGKTKRVVLENRIEEYNKPIRVSNPPGTITFELWLSLEKACRSDEKTMILVDGEEDLATLPAIVLAPAGTTVLYGMPEKGVVVVDVSKAKERVMDILRRMEG